MLKLKSLLKLEGGRARKDMKKAHDMQTRKFAQGETFFQE